MNYYSVITPETVKGLRDKLNDLIKQGFADSPLLIFDPDIKEWSTVTGLTYGGDDKIVKLYTDES
jgi:hypothetical protein